MYSILISNASVLLWDVLGVSEIEFKGIDKHSEGLIQTESIDLQTKSCHCDRPAVGTEACQLY